MRKLFKIKGSAGIILTLVGTILTIAQNYIEDAALNKKIDERIDERLNQKNEES